MFQTAKWRDAAHTEIEALHEDGRTVIVPVDPANSDYRLIVEGDAELDISPLPVAAYAAGG